MERVFVGITGGSGHAYAQRLVQRLGEAGLGVHVALSGAGAKVMKHELGIEADAGGETLTRHLEAWVGTQAAANVKVFGNAAVEAPASSGTAGIRAVVIIPCSMGTLARVSVGFSSNLVERAADVSLKEGRQLILVPRETPLSVIHLENMLRLARMGAIVLPAAPGFYHHPRTIDDLVDHVVSKILDRLDVDTLGIARTDEKAVRWSGVLEPPPEPGIEPAGPGEAGA